MSKKTQSIELNNGMALHIGGVSGSFLTTTKHYRKYLFMYGIMTVINVLEYYEFEEEYEECKKIIDSIKEQEDMLDITLFTRNTNECLKEVLKTYKKFNLTGVNAINNSKYYATLVLKEIEQNLRVS